MKMKSLLGGIAMSAIGIAALAHNGATGVTLERMNGMVALRDVMRQMAPMMQGQSSYDVRAVQVAGATIMAHAGQNMNTLFPQETIAAQSFAKPEIWANWQEFSALSEQLRVYGLGLSTAATNGLTSPVATQAAVDPSATMDGSTMQMGGTPMDQLGVEAAKFTLAELMGVVARRGSNVPLPASSVSASSGTPVGFDFSQMAAPQAFEMISGTCAACHSVFRSGS